MRHARRRRRRRKNSYYYAKLYGPIQYTVLILGGGGVCYLTHALGKFDNK